SSSSCLFFFFTDPATFEFYTLSLHDALPIYIVAQFKKLTVKMIVAFIVKQSGSFEFALQERKRVVSTMQRLFGIGNIASQEFMRSEEHTSELQSRFDLVCRLLLEKKKKKKHT